MFYPIDNDRDAMLEQQRLEESERQVDVEVSGQENQAAAGPGEGTLSQANLGASSLVLKNLIARIDATRERVKASDQELRNLMIEVKKNLEILGKAPLLVGFLANDDPAARKYAEWTDRTCQDK